MCRSSSLSYLSCLPSVRVCVVTRAKARSGSAVNHIQKDRENLIVCFLGSDFGAVWHSCVYKITPGCLLFLLRKTGSTLIPPFANAVYAATMCPTGTSTVPRHQRKCRVYVSCYSEHAHLVGEAHGVSSFTRRAEIQLFELVSAPAEIHHFPYACMT